MRVRSNILKTLLAGGLLLSLSACANDAQTGALIGGAGGAGLGAIIGNQIHGQSGEGALIGAAAGALGGYIVGNEMDKSKQQYRDDYRYAPPPPHYSPPPRYERYDSYGSGGGYYERSYRRYDDYGPGYERRTYERYEYER